MKITHAEVTHVGLCEIPRRWRGERKIPYLGVKTSCSRTF